MRKISGQLTQELKAIYGEDDIRRVDAHPVKTFGELMGHIARLSYLNKDHLLFFRGQSSDYRNKSGASSFYPSIYRGERLAKAELEARFEMLTSFSKRLADAFSKSKIEGASDVKKRRYIQWSILQHYEVCPTPLLDFSQSARVACSFATLDKNKSEAYFFVFGLPYVTNRISINSEHDLVNIRLLSICPPDALRPYYQEGYLVGTDESTTDFQSKDEFDFNARLIAKFRFTNKNSFWAGGFDPIPKIALYPEGDKIQALCEDIGNEIETELDLGRPRLLLQAWVGLEAHLMNIARSRSEKVYSAHEALLILQNAGLVSADLLSRLERVRRLRNTIVHTPKKAPAGELAIARKEIDDLTELVRAVEASLPRHSFKRTGPDGPAA